MIKNNGNLSDSWPVETLLSSEEKLFVILVLSSLFSLVYFQVLSTPILPVVSPSYSDEEQGGHIQFAQFECGIWVEKGIEVHPLYRFSCNLPQDFSAEKDLG